VSPPATAEYPKTVVLRDGAHLVLAEMTDAERPAVAALLGRLPAAGAGLVVVAREEESVTAAVALEPVPAPGLAVALHIGLQPAYRGRRLGTWMLLDAIHVAAGRGAERLLVETSAANGDFLAALARLDFVAERAVGPGDDMVVLAKRLHHGWTDF